MADTTCEECGNEIESTDDVETETVNEMTVEEESDGQKTVGFGANRRDVFMCKGCGKILGVE